jgi:neurofibromin 1
MQSSTLELINGLVSLLHPPSVADVAMEAMDALLTLHHPDKIEMWNPVNYRTIQYLQSCNIYLRTR